MVERRDNRTLGGTKTEVLAAIEVCRQRWARSLLADPLAYAEFDDKCAHRQFAASQPVDVDFVTRPKQCGGTRLEILPDFATSVQLQILAQRLSDGDLSLPHSFSAKIFSPKCMVVQPYEHWWEPISTWIRQRLVEGKTVIVADIRNYFSAISMSTIKHALRSVHLDEQDIERTLKTVSDINSTPAPDGTTRPGLPVSHDSLFWLVADLVLRPVDEWLSRNSFILGHVRWVDDFFIAVDPAFTDRVLTEFSTALQKCGFRLNESKTRIFTSITDFERQSLTHEHRIVSSLMMTCAHGHLSKSQLDAFTKLVEMNRAQSLEDSRLWKRIYALAARLGTAALATEAISDLRHFPSAEDQISTYLGTLNWPCGTAIMAINQISRASTDSQAIRLLQALLISDFPVRHDVFRALRDLSTASEATLHPYALVLLHACLVMEKSIEREEIIRQLMPLVQNSPSPMARRAGIELLWSFPSTRRRLTKLISEDISWTVRGLAYVPTIRGQESNGAYSLTNENVRPCLPFANSGSTKLQQAFMRVAA